MPIHVDDICLNKAAIIERSIRRLRAEYQANPQLDNFTHIDAMTLNIERACRAAIDLAMHLIARDRLGMPQTSAESFRLLHQAGYISKEIVGRMTAMTGFRNIAIHEYQVLDMSVLHRIAQTRWRSLVDFCAALAMTIDAT